MRLMPRLHPLITAKAAARQEATTRTQPLTGQLSVQGKHALVTHFQNSSLLHEDKRCRPILFHSDGATAGEQEPFPTGSSARGRSHRSDSVTHVDSGSTAASMTNGASRTSLAGISENEDGPSLPQSGPAGSADSLLAA